MTGTPTTFNFQRQLVNMEQQAILAGMAVNQLGGWMGQGPQAPTMEWQEQVLHQNQRVGLDHEVDRVEVEQVLRSVLPDREWTRLQTFSQILIPGHQGRVWRLAFVEQWKPWVDVWYPQHPPQHPLDPRVPAARWREALCVGSDLRGWQALQTMVLWLLMDEASVYRMANHYPPSWTVPTPSLEEMPCPLTPL